MVTDLLRSMTFDTLGAVQSKGFSGSYPTPLEDYVKKTDESTAVKHLGELAVLLSEGSVMMHVGALKTSKNELFLALIASLKTVQESSPDKESALAKYLHSLETAGAQIDSVFTRECQQLLLMVTGEDSAIVQLASPADVDTRTLPGIPSVTTARSLLGGARLFHNGKLRDESWRARLTRILSVI